MTTIHLVYPYGSKISCPDAIGRNLAKRLLEQYNYNVVQYDWDEPRAIKPGSNDILLGHPHPKLGTCFRMSYKQSEWKRIIVMSPYASGTNVQVAFLEPFLKRCDLYLAITGNYWFSLVKDSLFSHWFPKMKHLDLAVDRNDFPVIKRKFNLPGNRRFLYVGHTAWVKNVSYLTQIAQMLPDVEFSWIGHGDKIHGLKPLGSQDFSTLKAKQIIASHDFMITVGNSDANPITILESMAWGLIPVCTPQSGYINYPGTVNIPLGNAQKAVEILNHLQYLPEGKLQEMQVLNWEALDNHFNWDRFARQVAEAIESDTNPSLNPISLISRLRIFWGGMTSPHSYLRPGYLIRYYYHRMIKKQL